MLLWMDRGSKIKVPCLLRIFKTTLMTRSSSGFGAERKLETLLLRPSVNIFCFRVWRPGPGQTQRQCQSSHLHRVALSEQPVSTFSSINLLRVRTSADFGHKGFPVDECICLLSEPGPEYPRGFCVSREPSLKSFLLCFSSVESVMGAAAAGGTFSILLTGTLYLQV